MAYTRPMTGDYQHWSQTEAVTVLFRAFDGGETSVSVAVARRGGYTTDPLIFSELQSSPERVAWHLPASLLSGNVPDERTLIRVGSGDSEVNYVASQGVREARLGASLSHYSCACVRMDRK